MTVLNRFITSNSKGLRGVRVVPAITEHEDLRMFKLMPFETISLFRKGNRTYIELYSRKPNGPWNMLDRLNSMTKYLKALNTKAS